MLSAGTTPGLRSRLVTESAANCITHALGLILSLIGAPILVVLASRIGDAGHIAGCSVYSASLILLFTASTYYHLHEGKPGENRRLILDHICIYLLIAGTYSAFCLTSLRGTWGWVLVTAIWALAMGGVAFKLRFGIRYERFSTALYIIMGWLAFFSLFPVVERTPDTALALLGGGGAVYTGGVCFYARRWYGRVRYSHALWHLSVVAGSALHFFAVRECLLSVAA